MILKNRTWMVKNCAMKGFPYKFVVRYDKDIKEAVLVEEGFFTERMFSMEELEDMMAILKKVQKEKREDRL